MNHPPLVVTVAGEQRVAEDGMVAEHPSPLDKKRLEDEKKKLDNG